MHLFTRSLRGLLACSAALFIGASVLSSCSSKTTGVGPNEDLLSFVNPFIGSGEHGHTFPGATRPNAMVQFSPDTHLIGWDASSG